MNNQRALTVLKMKKWGRNKGVAPTLFPILLMSCDKFVTRMCKLLS